MKFLALFILMLSNVFVFSQGFTALSEKKTNISFKNKIIETDSINGITYPFLYQFGGVAVGDINNDGLEDLFFTGRQVSDELYLNKGNLNFKNVSSKYIRNKKKGYYHTGAVMVDVNNDGWLDIYVSVAGPSSDGESRANLLYINKKGRGFDELAKEYGLADTSNTTQTVFFDADLDGDLDCFMLNHVQVFNNMQVNFQVVKNSAKNSGMDKFYLNEGGVFIDKTKEYGVGFEGEGLGVVVSDINNDGFPDIYVTNDGMTPDRILTNKNGKYFVNTIDENINHGSLFSMGVDIGDVNNDGLFDLFTADMANEGHIRSKTNMAGMSSKEFWKIVGKTNQYQFMYNSLQLNQGQGNFSEIAQLSGISKSDWSWAPLFADFDNDGFQDLFISNGFHKDLKDNDYIRWLKDSVTYSHRKYSFNEVQKRIPTSKIPNNVYKNNQDLTFSKMNFEWGMSNPVNVNGTVYSDLDNDGDLDLVMNVTDDVSFIMENVSNTNNYYLDVKLSGLSGNEGCIGSTVEIFYEGKSQKRELQTVRGYQSSVSSKIHFGLGGVNELDSLIVMWKKRECTILRNVNVGHTLEIDYNSSIKFQLEETTVDEPYFKEIILEGLSDYVHEEFKVDDFKDEVLLPHKMSELGPFVTVQDINNDGLEDVFVGGARAYASKMYYQNSNGGFDLKINNSIENDKNFEDMQSVFFDFDNDGDKDLYVVSGGNESPINHASLSDRLYENINNNFSKTDDVLPDIRVSGQKVLAKDINNDGWIDLVVFGRQVPKAYPSTPKTSILINKKGRFVDEIKTIAPELEFSGMVTDAIFTDFDSDGDQDMIVVGEWMPIVVLENDSGFYKNVTSKLNLDKFVGWWSAIKEVEVQGKKQYILGNISPTKQSKP